MQIFNDLKIIKDHWNESIFLTHLQNKLRSLILIIKLHWIREKKTSFIKTEMAAHLCLQTKNYWYASSLLCNVDSAMR